MKTSSRLGFALGVVALGMAALANACGGAENMDVLGEVGPATTSGATTSSGMSTSGSTSGNTSSSGSASSSGNTSSSGEPTDGCAPCGALPQGCTRTDSCSCTYTCPDSGGAVTCQWTPDGRGGCPEDTYCDAPNCISGVCVKRGTAEPADRAPQCGCNGVTYWNAGIAKKAGMAIRTGGACSVAVGKACGGIAGTSCPGAGSCNAQVAKKAECNMSDGEGLCWQLPTSCPVVVLGGPARPCGGGSLNCLDDCSAIRKQAAWYADSNCPQ